MIPMARRLLVLLSFASVAVGCSTAEPLDLAEFPPDAALDCTDDNTWVVNGSPDPDAEGFATAIEALEDTLAPFMEDHDELRGPQQIRDASASLLDPNNREVVVATASEVSPSNWFVTSIGGCSGFERF